MVSRLDIYPFNKNDIFELVDLYESQNVTLPGILPEIGFVVRDESGRAIAAGFLRQVEGNIGQLDSYVTNSKASAEVRHNAIDLLTQTLINTAKNMNLTGLMVITQIQSIANRAVELGFRINPDVVLGLLLNK